jgi:hypothetical protein
MRARHGGVGAALALLCGVAQAQAPTTFGTIIGNGLLCRDHTDNIYYYNYLLKHFGAPYKHDGGAFWFRTDGASLWGTTISEVMVSDDTSPMCSSARWPRRRRRIWRKPSSSQVGTHYTVIDTSAYPVREAKPASRIVYFDTKSKIYCAKYQPLPPVQPPPVRQRLK